MNNSINKNWLSVITIILLVVNIATLAVLWTNKEAGNKELKGPNAPNAVFEFLTKELSLNKMQQESYKKLKDDHQVIQRQLKDSIRNAKDAFFSLISQPDIPDSLLLAYSKKANAFNLQMDIITFRHFQQLRAICDPGQQQKFDNIIQEVMRRMAGPRQGPPPNRGEEPQRPPGSEPEPPAHP
ncbi:hypothetical protein BH11BAC4_BH11BAC4_15000 [soil metagenome]